MNKRITAAAITSAALILTTLTACGSSDGSSTLPAEAPAGQTSQQPPASKPAASPKPAAAVTKTLGTPAQTVGDPDSIEGTAGGALQITPTSVIYLDKTFSDKPTNGTFVIITTKDKTTTDEASETAPMGGGGWTYIAPDGQAITTLSGDASNVVPDGFEGGGTIQAGTYAWSSQAFDIAPKQAGGTLTYKDGAGHVTRWKLPATTTGPEASKVQQALK